MNKSENKKKKASPRKVLPPRWSTFILCAYAKLSLWFKYKIKINRQVLKKQKRGFILIFNHFSNQDHFLLAAATNYRRISFVMSSYFFYNKTLSKILKIHRTIKKEQFKPDISAIRQIRKVIDLDGLVAIAPTGQVGLVGKNSYINPAIVKLVKMCNCDVIALQMHGTHLAFPKWRTSPRKCAMHLEFVKAVEKEELAILSDQVLYERLVASIDIDEYAEQKKLMRPIKGKTLTAGLENVLIKCPKCLSYYTNVTAKNEMRCTVCHNTVYMDKWGFLHPQRPEDVAFESELVWYQWQKDQMVKEYEQPDFCLRSAVTLLSNPNKPFERISVGQGVLVLTQTRLYYEGQYLDKKIVKEFSYGQLTQLPFSPNSHFEIPDHEALYRFEPTNKKEVIHWVQTVDVINQKRSDNNG